MKSAWLTRKPLPGNPDCGAELVAQPQDINSAEVVPSCGNSTWDQTPRPTDWRTDDAGFIPKDVTVVAVASEEGRIIVFSLERR